MRRIGWANEPACKSCRLPILSNHSREQLQVPFDAEHKLRYAVSIDGGPLQIVDAEAKRDWDDGVERNGITSVTDWPALTAGDHRLRVYALDPGVVLDSLVIDFGGLAKAYLAPPETIAK